MTRSISPTASENRRTRRKAAADRRQSNSSDAALLSVDDVSALLTCSARTVRRMADSGQMPRPVRLNSLVRWRRTDLDTWLEAGCPRCGRAGR